jgi:hypothetical protein
MQALAREELGGAEHPSASKLIARHRGALPAAAAAAITEHLSLCSACTALALDVAELFGGDEDEEEPAPGEVEAVWRQLHTAQRKAETVPPARPPRRPWFRSLAFAYGLAASFAAAGIAVLLLRPLTGPPPRPQANAGLYDLAPAAGERGQASRPAAIRFRTHRDSALLILNPAVVAEAPQAVLRIRRADGVEVWRLDGLDRQPNGAFHLGLPAGALAPGSYSLELYGTGATGAPGPLLGTYWITLEP